jgi:hypothetical protein
MSNPAHPPAVAMRDTAAKANSLLSDLQMPLQAVPFWE